jgi:hypothetical protein
MLIYIPCVDHPQPPYIHFFFLLLLLLLLLFLSFRSLLHQYIDPRALEMMDIQCACRSVGTRYHSPISISGVYSCLIVPFLSKSIPLSLTVPLFFFFFGFLHLTWCVSSSSRPRPPICTSPQSLLFSWVGCMSFTSASVHHKYHQHDLWSHILGHAL